jgi:hypothetical protein
LQQPASERRLECFVITEALFSFLSFLFFYPDSRDRLTALKAE